MRATLLGHACWLIETTAGVFLTDPVLFDPFEEGTVTACPRRAIHLDRLPALQGIVVSHCHLDHYDLPSLAALPRHVPVWCPGDPFLLYGLQRLGFSDVRTLEAFVPRDVGGLRLLPTPSLNREVLEYGLVWQDETGILFNQVDTFLAAETVQRLRRDVGRPDVHLAMYASQHFQFFESKRADTALLHGINLHTASQLAAKCIVPSSAGFRFVDDLAWLNPHIFPITRAQFVQDLQGVDCTLRVEVVNPGDTMTLLHGDITVQRQAVDFVTMEADDTHLLAYDASAPVPPLVDGNPAGYGAQGLREFAQGLLEVGFPQYLARGLATRDPVVAQYMQHDVVYQIAVVFPDTTRSWTYHFDRQRQALQRLPETSTLVPQVRTSITASTLVDCCLGRRSYFAVRPHTRRSSQVFEVAQTAQGIVARTVDLPDALTHYIMHEMPGASRRGQVWIDHVTGPLLASQCPGNAGISRSS